MIKLFNFLRHSLLSKISLAVGLLLFFTLAVWVYFNMRYHRQKVMERLIAQADIVSGTILRATDHAMQRNLQAVLPEIISTIGQQKPIEAIRIYSKSGQVSLADSSRPAPPPLNQRAPVCQACHHASPPSAILPLTDRTRIVSLSGGRRLLGIVSPIYAKPGCATKSCHPELPGTQVLGILDVTFSLSQTDTELATYSRKLILFALFVFLITVTLTVLLLMRFVNRPIQKMIARTRRIARGKYSLGPDSSAETTRLADSDQTGNDEMGRLSAAILQMEHDIARKQAELNRQRDEYQNLFELVPCIITVQDRNYKLIGYNREFANKFNPKEHDHCFHAYKGLNERCPVCPVERTFRDGLPHFSEETGRAKDGSLTHWIVRTSPIKNEQGEIVAAMEMSLDITHRKRLEAELDKTEKKYYAIFNNIPNPVFVLDYETLDILDCNNSVRMVYGFAKKEIINTSFLDLFTAEEREAYDASIRTCNVVNQAKHFHSSGEPLFVTIRVSPSDYPGRKVLLVTTGDITARLQAEQQLIQASKMATLGEMATGVAHELNQPLAVIKTASSFFMKKINKKEPIAADILLTMSTEIDRHVDRATKIINHMRQFGRKSDLKLEPVAVNEVLEAALDILGQQLKVRNIEVRRDLAPDLPPVMADPGRLEQVFINLLINARDAVETRNAVASRDQAPPGQKRAKRIDLTTCFEKQMVMARVCDNGDGIPESFRDKIFEPFFTTKKVGQGTGLGLSISYNIIKEFGAGIKALGNADQGACFELRFPLSDHKQAGSLRPLPPIKNSTEPADPVSHEEPAI